MKEKLNKKQCIICREVKTAFNREHIFPETIGGSFVIDLVCADCNKRMGDTIDTPFVNHKQILLYRHHYGLSRGNRGIRLPFEGPYQTSDGKKFVVSKNGNDFVADYKIDFGVEGTEDEPVGRLTLSEKFMGSEEELVKKYTKIFEERTGKKVGYHTVERGPGNPVVINERDSDNKFILGCLKIGFETAATLIPSYIDDELAIAYSKMLLAGDFNRSLKHYINPPFALHKEMAGILNSYPELGGFHCLAALLTTPGQGLIACIKIFEMAYTFILSPRETFTNQQILLLLINSLEKKNSIISLDR